MSRAIEIGIIMGGEGVRPTWLMRLNPNTNGFSNKYYKKHEQ